MTRKQLGNVRPWNFEEMVDLEKSSNDFIIRMRTTDTYLIGEPVLPKQSLIYQKYEVLSELNNVRIEDNGSISKLDIDIKQRIFEELFRVKKTISVKALKEWLVNESLYKSPKIKGLADKKKFLSSLSTFHDFSKIFGKEFVIDPQNNAQLEELAEWLTLFEDKKILLLKLNNSNYNYDKATINKITNLRYQGTGKFSKKLLTELKTETKIPGTHVSENYSILELMWSTQLNFMQIIHEKNYSFESQINDYNAASNTKKDQFEMIDDLHCSPALKRGITQSLRVVQDIVKFMGHEPNKIFIEFTRDDEDSDITQSRYKQLNKQYAKISAAVKKLPTQLQEMDQQLNTELSDNRNKLANERLMLYFLQRGHSLYSDAPIDINQLFTSKYHVDHILPQSYIKDDSLENKALVLASENERKIDNLLIDDNIVRQNIDRWKSLKEQNLMGPKKFRNLTRSKISDNQLKGFIQRQLVQTSQMVKNVTDILTATYENTACIETRASLSTEFRRAFSNLDRSTGLFQNPEFVKNRDVNDFHHAQDAYLACVVGQYRLKKYPKDNAALVYDAYSAFLNKIKKESRKKYGKMPRYVQNGFIIGSMFNGETQINKDGEIIWDQTIKDNIRKIFNYKQFNVVRQVVTNSNDFYKQTIYPKSATKKLIPIKQNWDTSLYGGFTGEQISYSVLVDIDGKKKLFGVPIRIAKQIENNDIDLNNWLQKAVKYKKNLSVVIPKVPIYQRVMSEKNGDLLLTSAKEIINNNQLYLPAKYSALMSLFNDDKPIAIKVILQNYGENIFIDIYDHLLNKIEIQYPFYKGELKKLQDNRTKFIELESSQQVKIIQQLLLFLHASASNANLKGFGNLTDRFGRKKSALEFSGSQFVFESPTGLFKTYKLI